MAEPQNLKFRQYQAFLALEGKKTNKNEKVGPILHVIFDYLSGKKKILKIGPLLDFYGFLEQKKGKFKNGPIFMFNIAIESYGHIN